MTNPKLTKRVVDAAEPSAKRKTMWDGELRGFGLRIEPGGHKTFVVRYRAGGGRSGVLRQTTLGRYGVVTLDEARTNARKLLGAAAAGGDPIGERKRARRIGLTIAELCDWYLEQATSGRLLGEALKQLNQVGACVLAPGRAGGFPGWRMMSMTAA